MKLRFTQRALDNLSDIADYLGARDPVAGKRARAAIYGTLRLLIAFPQLGRKQSVESDTGISFTILSMTKRIRL